METVCGIFLISDMSDTPNIMGLDILSKAGIIISGRNGTWKFKKNKNKENRLLKETKMKEEFVELRDQIFQTVEIAKNEKSKIDDKYSSTEILLMKADMIEMTKQINKKYNIASEIRGEMWRTNQESLPLRVADDTGLDRKRQRNKKQEIVTPDKMLRLKEPNGEKDLETVKDL